MKIVVMPSDMDAPGCYRLLFPARQLHNQGGHEVIIPKHDVEELGEGRRRVRFNLSFNPPIEADMWVIQQRNERHWADGGIRALRDHGIAVVEDVDDNYLELPSYNPAFMGGHPYRRDDGVVLNREARRRISKRIVVTPNKHNRLHMFKTFEQVDLLTVSTPYLAEVYSRFQKNIEVIRNRLDWDIWSTVIPQYTVQRERPRIGWLATHRFRGDDIAVISKVIPKIMKDYPNVDFVANSEEMHDALGVPVEQRIIESEYAFWEPSGLYQVGDKTAVCDIGLVPLAMNGLNEGKSHLKGMEYNAAGIPFIASPTESYKDYWCQEGLNGYVAHSQHDWDETIRLLLDNDNDRRNMGKYGRELAEQHSYQANWREWEDSYERVLGDACTKVARESIVHAAVQKVSELSWMLRNVRDLEPKVVVEVGSAGGGTFWSLCQVCPEDATVISIDMEAGSPLDERQGKDVYTRFGRQKLFDHAKGDQKIVLLTGDSQTEAMKGKLIEALNGRPIDFLFIDADHRYEGVKRDFELYSPLVRPGGLIAFHDIGPQNVREANVMKLWKEVRTRYESSEFFGQETWGWGKWGGIGLLRQKA